MFILLSVCAALAGGFTAGSSAAVRRTALVRGYVQVCAADGCWVEGLGYCDHGPQSCVTSDRVAAINASGRRVATVRLRHARFTLNLAPGRYTLEVLGDGKRVHGQVFQRLKLRVIAHRTTHVHFRFDVP